MKKQQLVIASGNAHKVEEFEGLLGGLGLEIQSAEFYGGMPYVNEIGDTFSANALLKAEALKERVPHDVWILADDSGLEVDALAGEPGIFSARYAGADASDADNVKKLLLSMKDVPASERTARFRCVLCLIDGYGSISYHEGNCEGTIAFGVSGANGFGYDPVFIPNGYDETLGQLGEVVKQTLSHRAIAVQAVREYFEAKLCKPAHE